MTDSLPAQPVKPMLPANEPERLAALHRYQILDTPAEAAFDRITTLTARLFKIPTVLISLVDESRAWFKSSIGFDAPEVSRDDTICNFAVLTDEPSIVPDTRLDARFTCNPFVQCEPGMRFYAGAPLIDRDGFNLGTLCMLDTVPRDPLTAEQQATLVDLAAMVVSELELRLAAQQIARVDAALVEITQGVAKVTGGDFFDELVRHFAKVLGTDYVYIGLVEGTEPKMMRTIATCNRGNIVENLEYRLQDTPCGEAILHGRGSANEQRKICCYPRNVQARFPDAPLLKPLAVESYISIPFFGADGRVLGLLGVMDGKPLVNVQLAESLLTIFASRIATELERQQSELLLVEQTRLLEAVSTGQPLDECLSVLCSSIAKLSPNTRACVLLTDVLQLTFPRSIAPDFPPSLSQGLKDAPINELANGTCGTAVYSGEPVTCADMATDERWSQSWRDLWIAHDIRADYFVPIVGIDNLPLGSLMLCFNEARLPTDWEYKLGEFGTKIASIAIERLRSSENLRESEERLNLALAAADMATWDADLSTGKTIWSAKQFQILGYDPTTDGAATVEMWMNLVHPDDRSSVMQAWATAQRERSLYRCEYRFVRADTGAVVWATATGRFLDNQAGEAMRCVGVMFDISERQAALRERQQAEAALQASQQFVQKIAETIPGMVYIYDLIEQRNVYINRQSLEFLGHTPEQLQEMGADMSASLTHPDDLASMTAYIEGFQTAQTGEVRGLESRSRHASGQWRWFLHRNTVFSTTPTGNTHQIIGVSIDITDRQAALRERKQAEAAIQLYQARLAFVLNNTGVGIWLNSFSLGALNWDERTRELFFVTPDVEPTIELFWSRVHPDDREPTRLAVEAALRDGTLCDRDYRVVSPDPGEIRWIRSAGKATYAADGTPISFDGINYDITKRKLAEEELRQSQALVQRQLSEIEAIYQTAPIGLAILDRDLRYIRLNQRLAEINGIDIDAHIGRTIHEIVPDLADRVELPFQRVLATGEPLHDLELSGETKAQPGVERTWIENCYPLQDETGKIVAINVVTQEITDRKRAEAELARANGILSATIDGTSDVVFVKNLQGRYVIANSTAAEWLDTGVADILGRDDTSLFPPEIARHIISMDRQVIQSGESIAFEEEVPNQGTLRSLLSVKYPWRDPQGQIVGVIGISRDITDRKRTEAAIQESRTQLEFLLAAAEFGDWNLNLIDRTAHRSLRHDRIFGYESLLPEWTYDMFLDHILPEERSEVDRKYQNAIDNNQPWDFECRIRRADNQVRWIWANGYVYHNAQGIATRMLGLVADITDRKNAETALLESEERFRTLADNMSQFAWMTDENGWIFWYNSRWFEYTGTTLAQMQGWGWQSVHHPEHVDRVVERIRHCFETGEAWEDTFPLRGRDGTYRWFLSRALPIRDELGRIRRWFGTNTDITDRKLAEAALAERNKELDSFVHTVSHDLKAPLRAITNLSRWIEDDLEERLPPDNQQQFQLLRTRVKRMESMIDSLLLYARAGRQEAQLETFDLAELLSEIIDSLAPPESFSIEIQPPLPKLTTKRLFLSQVLTNLISNAIKHHTSVTGHLHIWAIEHPDCHEFIIKDDGPGIAPEHHEQVFAIFQTLKGMENSDSTGVGLAIVKKIVETEQGTIRLESSLGRGTTFYVTWPKIH